MAGGLDPLILAGIGLGLVIAPAINTARSWVICAATIMVDE